MLFAISSHDDIEAVQTIFKPNYIDYHLLMFQFHKLEEEKHSIVVIEPEHRKDWLSMTHEDVFKLSLPMGGGYLAEHCPKPPKTVKMVQMDEVNK